MGTTHSHWWERRGTVALLVLLAMVPLLLPPVAPLIDLPGHMGRYRVQLSYADSAILRQFYDFHWALIGNLGVDLLIIPMAKLFGLELGVKLIVMAIPAMTVGGLLWIAREVHGEVQPTSLFALPLAYGHPFLFGFVNFALSMAFALLAFALWLQLARLGRTRLRAAVFVVLAPLIWLTHTFGWGTLGVLAFSAELIRQHDRGGSWPHAIFHAGVQVLSIAPPLMLMIVWRSGHVSGQTGDWFNWAAKLQWFTMTLRDRWQAFDMLSVWLLVMLVIYALADRRLEISRNLGASALFLAAVFLLLPRIVFGSAYADMRITPFMIAIAVIGIRQRPGASVRFANALALGGLAFFGARIAANTVSFARASADYGRALGALDHVPVGGRLVSFVGHPCRTLWTTNRMEHLPAMAIVRRQAFSNDQWDMAGAQLLTAKRPEARHYRGDPSEIVTAVRCRGEFWRPLDVSLATFPRDAFDYVWLIDPPSFDPRWTRGLTPIWMNGRDTLYRVDDRRMLVRFK
ncbi:MAG: hypothetical protein H0X36_09590 [Sphingomonadaceae bacterium]|nr:hypothetical protein [Sphingomonadaceae bacterium]